MRSINTFQLKMVSTQGSQNNNNNNNNNNSIREQQFTSLFDQKDDPAPTQQPQQPHSSEKKAGKDNSMWRQKMALFAQMTTLHGVRFAARDHYTLRKAMWILLLLVSSSLTVFQVIERVTYFYSYPVTVNVHANFNSTLPFPTLTICNQNAFRATAAASNDLYEVIEHIFGRYYSNDSYDKLHAITLEELNTRTAHLKSDFIVRCEWNGQPCSPDNFTDVLTDFGLCYSFNQHGRPLSVSAADNGIKLTLNVEQYEYMPGSNGAAGIKMLLHDRKEFPKVAELGLAVPTGSQAFVGMQLSRVQNLPEPRGSCRVEKSPFYQRYSIDSCQSACFSETIGRVCGCRHMFMPDDKGWPPVCTVQQYVDCYRKKIDAVKSYVLANCTCPVPCDYYIFDPTISLATSSNFASETLHFAGDKQLEKKYQAARETISRMNKSEFQHLYDLVSKVGDLFSQLKHALTVSSLDNMRHQRHVLLGVYQWMNRVWQQRRYLLEWQAFLVKKNFEGAKNAMEERTFNYLLLGFQEFAFQVETRILQLSNPPTDLPVTENVRQSLYLQTVNLIKGRVDLCDRAFDNYTQLFNSYEKGIPVFEYVFNGESPEDQEYVVPKPLLFQSLNRNYYAKRHSRRVGYFILETKFWLLRYLNMATTSYLNRTVDEEELHLIDVMYLNRGRNYFFSKSNFYSESVEYPSQFIKKEIETFDMHWRHFQKYYVKMLTNVDALIQGLSTMNHTLFWKFEHAINRAYAYFKTPSITKLEVAQEVTSDFARTSLQDFRHFLETARAHANVIHDGWSLLLNCTNQIWKSVLEDENMKTYYSVKNISEYLQNFTEVASDNEAMFLHNRHQFNIRPTLAKTGVPFLLEVDKLNYHMTSFVDRSQIDDRFVRENLLQLNVFYREKSYELILQQPAYNLFSLSCDIGGAMGLFLGASVLTLYELLEMLVQHSFSTLSQSKR